MANKKIPFQYFLKQDRSSNPKKSGKYYGKRFNSTVLGTRGLAEHMIGHALSFPLFIFLGSRSIVLNKAMERFFLLSYFLR